MSWSSSRIGIDRDHHTCGPQFGRRLVVAHLFDRAGQRPCIGAGGRTAGDGNRSDQWHRRQPGDRADGRADRRTGDRTLVAAFGLRIRILVAAERQAIVTARRIQRELVEVRGFESRAAQRVRSGGCRLLVIEYACNDTSHVLSLCHVGSRTPSVAISTCIEGRRYRGIAIIGFARNCTVGMHLRHAPQRAGCDLF